MEVPDVDLKIIPNGGGNHFKVLSVVVNPLGALVCTAKDPRCTVCPLSIICLFSLDGAYKPIAGK